MNFQGNYVQWRKVLAPIYRAKNSRQFGAGHNNTTQNWLYFLTHLTGVGGRWDS